MKLYHCSRCGEIFEREVPYAKSSRKICKKCQKSKHSFKGTHWVGLRRRLGLK